MAGVTRLELATSGVTGQRSNQLSYTPAKFCGRQANPSCRSGTCRSAIQPWADVSRRPRSGAALVSAADRPNILPLTVDDMSADSVGVFGSKLAGTTPNMDKLASQSLRFADAHVTVGNCMPCRNVLLSGLYSHNNKTKKIIVPFWRKSETICFHFFSLSDGFYVQSPPHVHGRGEGDFEPISSQLSGAERSDIRRRNCMRFPCPRCAGGLGGFGVTFGFW
jgi:hypothetical protein